VIGIPIRIHFTFLFIVVWFASQSARAGGNVALALVFLLAVFACVVLHELGHAAMAKRFGVRTLEIVLYPIGGVARLQRMPSGRAEFLIAVAGPAVNVVIAAALLAALLALGTGGAEMSWTMSSLRDLVRTLFLANLMIFFFNLIPAFPMDGGRMLRAGLAILLGEQRATGIATLVGQGFAIAFALFGLLQQNLFLVLIALFVFAGAAQESAFTRRRAVLVGRFARDAMITRFETLAPQDPLSRAARLLIDANQQDFPVIDAWGRLAGVLSRADLLRALAGASGEEAVLDAMDREILTVAPDASLEEVIRVLQADPRKPVMVVEETRLVGMVTFENLARFVEIARRSGALSPD
jgi:Zn-dependent protease